MSRDVLRALAGAVAKALAVTLSIACPACGGGASGGGSSGATSNGGAGTPLAVSNAQVVWLDATTMVWPGASLSNSYKLYYSATGNIAPTSTGVTGADNAGGTALVAGPVLSTLAAQHPQYASAVALTVPAALAGQIKALLTDELVVVQSTGTAGTSATQVQTGPVLDVVYGSQASGAALGLSFGSGDVPTFRVWAPTAQSVMLNLYPTATGGSPTSYAMTLDAATGIWSYTAADGSWTNGAYYTYTAAVMVDHAVVNNEVTDPYSLSLSGNSIRSMVVNLADATTQPAGWPGALIATPGVPTNSVLYELHIRDFSINDATVPAAHRGKYLAFTDTTSTGMTHLAALAAAGLTHVHLLPTFDIATIDELSCVQSPAIGASTGAGTQAEIAVKATQGTDCFNWGYDPFHYGAPEGSYSSNADDGLVRVREFRQMVQALHATGLRVVMDVVYNHTDASGQDPKSVLDRIVPGYYHRRDANGTVQNYSCCADTATERVMMEKLMTDTLKIWAGQYKIDGFRFDIMGMIPKTAMLDALAAVDAVSAADGRLHTYFYGEGWTPNAAVSAVISPATQLNMAGTGIGTFNDRIRDAVRGGGCCDSGAGIVAGQGFISGLCYDMNPQNTSDCGGTASDAAFILQNRASVSLAGNLASFPLRAGVTGANVDYFGNPSGYTQLPQENIAYVSVHDNETLFDISEYKHPAGTAPAAVARAQVVGLSMALLSQGVPFLHAGDELLRSKSGDSNSFDSGDYFNRIYWDGSSNNWAVGLPPDNTGSNTANAATLSGILTTRIAPDQSATLAAGAAVMDFLKIRRATDLFRLTSAADINSCLSFPDQGAQVHGLIVERVQGSGCVSSTTSGYKSVVVLFNGSKTAQSYSIAAYANKTKGTASGNVNLHPVQVAGADPIVQGGWNFTASASTGTFTVPARTTAVFVEYE